jgi:hypothetical protein
MSKKSVFCIATSCEQARRIIGELNTANFSKNDIFVVFPDKDAPRDFANEKKTKAPEGAIAGGALGWIIGIGAGGAIGSALGWIVGIGAMAIPGAGPFIAAGPIMAILSGATIGATSGGFAGGLIGLGIPEFEARRYERKVKADNVLTLGSHRKLRGDRLGEEHLVTQASAQDICTTGETFTPKAPHAADRPLRPEPMLSAAVCYAVSRQPGLHRF